MAKQKRNIGDLRELLFNQLDALCDVAKEVDLDRARVVNDTSKQIIETAKVEVEYARVIQGAMTMPFIENQDGSDERPHHSLPPPPAAAALPDGEPDADERTRAVLNGGPAEDHPWRGLGSRVHRLEH